MSTRKRGRVLTVLLADDHDVTRYGVKMVLEIAGPGLPVVECRDLRQAKELAGGCESLALAVLDLKMPGMCGVSGLSEFTSRFPAVRTVLLSGYYQRADVHHAMRLGAAGFIPKGLSVDAMVGAFQLVLAGERFVPSDVLEFEQTEGGLPRALTTREREVLDRLLEGSTNKEIAGHLKIEEVTVKVHMASIYRKLGVRNRAQAVRVALNA